MKVFNKRGYAYSVGLVADVVNALRLLAVQLLAYRMIASYGDAMTIPMMCSIRTSLLTSLAPVK